MENEMRKSHLEKEQRYYLRFDSKGTTSLLTNFNRKMESGYSYREATDPHRVSEHRDSHETWTDGEYEINLSSEFQDNQHISPRRLSTMYSKSNKPAFFDALRPISRPKNPRNRPTCFSQLPLYSVTHYKSLFLTQDWQKSGRYVLLVNIDGRWEFTAVDDYIPIDNRTMETYWEMDFLSPWEIILIKAWAKVKGGYDKVARAKPSQFMQAFSNSCWKYFNLTRQDGKEFLKRYNPSRLRKAKVVLKTKDNEEVKQYGLTPNSCSYQLVNFVENRESEEKSFVMTIRGTTKNQWTGDMSFFDDRVLKFYKMSAHQINLERDFFMSGQDFTNLFSAAYVSAVHSSNFATGYQVVDIVPNESRAQLYEFTTYEDTFIDMMIRQFDENAIRADNEVRSSMLKGGNKRYLKMKYMLVKDNDFVVEKKDKQGSSHLMPAGGPNHSGVASNMSGSHMRNSNLEKSQYGLEFPTPRFTVFAEEYLKGYNKGQCSFVYLPAGRYILRLKSEHVDKMARYDIAWSANSILQFTDALISPEEKQDLIHDAVVSVMHKTPHFNFDKGSKTEMITVGGTFDQIGYGYVAIKASTSCPNSILLTVDPQKLRQEGYKLKSKYKDEKNQFTLKVEKGEYTSVVFKIDNDRENRQLVWPSHAFNIWRKKVGDPNMSRIKEDEGEGHHEEQKPKPQQNGGSNYYEEKPRESKGSGIQEGQVESQVQHIKASPGGNIVPVEENKGEEMKSQSKKEASQKVSQ